MTDADDNTHQHRTADREDEEPETMADVSHQPPYGGEVNRIFARGGDRQPPSEDV